MSADGKTTHGDELGTALWASAEDQEFFNQLKTNAQVIIMGRKTYDAMIYHSRPNDNIPRIVMSHGGPTPREVIADLEKKGCAEALLVGGSEINGEFFREKLINEMYLTIEPKLFGTGLPLAQMAGDEVKLRLLNVQQLNPQGTLLLHYHVEQ